MPHPGTHIAALRLLGNDPAIGPAIGGTSAERTGAGDAATVLTHRYACLGALGPDLLYFMLDGSGWTQAAQDLAVRLLAVKRGLGGVTDELEDLFDDALDAAGTLDPCNVLGLIEAGVDGVEGILDLGVGILENGLKAIVTDGLGLNLFSIFASPRQQGKGPEEWFWADHLHYRKTGQFARNLLDLAFLDARFRDHAPLRAYALGYLTHVVGDVVGHAYVNQIVGGPYRMHRQRHTLVENFIDAWAWRHTHRAKDGENPATGEPFLHLVHPNQAACGSKADALWHVARIDRFLDVGPGAGFLPAIDSALDDLAEALDSVDDAVFDADLPEIRDEAMFARWAELFLAALRDTYEGDGLHPTLLDGDGFPTAQNLASAYATALAVLGGQTSEPIEEPEFPDLSGAEQAAKDFLDGLLDALEAALDALTPPLPDFSGGFSLAALFEALVDWVGEILKAVAAVIAGVLSALKALCQLGTAITAGILEIAFFFLRKALWAGWAALRRILELRAYDQPLPDTVAEYPQLWQAFPNARRRGDYPVMESRSASARGGAPGQPSTRIRQDQLWTTLEPLADPAAVPHHVERPDISAIGQDFPMTGPGEFPEPATPHALLFHPRGSGADDMFGPAGFVPPVAESATTAGAQPRAYGGIVPNCRHALAAILAEAAKPGVTTVVPATLHLHDFNLDGDRGLGWLAWKLTGGQHRPAADQDAAVTTQPWS